jgi:hypothetical protein
MLAEKKSPCGMSGCPCSAAYKEYKLSGKHAQAHRVKSGKMESMSPPGFGGTVKHMQDKHPEISNPHAVAWSMYEKGDKSHKAAPKGTGAKTVSKEVSEKRSTALKAGGPGSGRHTCSDCGRSVQTYKDSNGNLRFKPHEDLKTQDAYHPCKGGRAGGSIAVKANMPTTTTKDADDNLSESTQEGKS